MDTENTRIRGTASAYARFIKGFIWKDIKTELNVLLEINASEYDVAESMEQIAKIQGRREAIQHMLDLPNQILDQLNEIEGGE